MSYQPQPLTRYNGWLPSSPEIYNRFLEHYAALGRRVFESNAAHLLSVAKFEKAIKQDQEMVGLFEEVFKQVSEMCHTKNFDHLLYQLDHVIDRPPGFVEILDEHGKPIAIEPIGIPVYLLFDLPGNTGAGYDLFRKPAFNAAMKDLLDSWGEYLKDPDSKRTLTNDKEGWFGEAGLKALEAEGRGIFNNTWKIRDPTAINRGYLSWDDFFTREFQPNARPVSFPHEKRAIHNACESTVYRKAFKVKAHDQFWLKEQAYSLYDMLDRNEEMVNKFIGGTVYQAFLSPQDYHRWHSPVDGTIVDAYNIPGTYYAVLPDEGAPANDPDLENGDPRGALVRSQGWLNVSATRAIIYIQANNPDIGLVAFIGVGMVEVSTCKITVHVGDEVKAGDQLGLFHFGGSSHTVIFGPHVRVEFEPEVIVDRHLLVRTLLAQAYPAS